VTAPSPSQTIGPFFRFGFAWMDATSLVDATNVGAIVLEGAVLDGAGAPVPDAVVEIWQADGAGAFAPETTMGWTGFGRCLTDEGGGFRFVTVAPGAVDEVSLPHINVSVFARGLLQRVVTRVYLPDASRAEPTDPVLASVPSERRMTLIAEPTPTGLRFDIRLQGEQETVFFAW
jgi:protocatechuate 3,4-dioxygenase alpha subunit